MKKIFLTIFLVFFSFLTSANTKQIKIDIENGDFIYKDYINISVDHPKLEVSKWEIDDVKPIKHFSKEFGETKKILNKNFTINLSTRQKSKEKIQNAHIHVSYYLNSKKGMVEKIFPFNTEDSESCINETATHVNTSIATEKTTKSNSNSKNENSKKSWTNYLQNLVKKTDSIWIRIIFALLLGILLSLTPCIYPMIPITVGILQSQGSKSLISNFILSFVYVMGISMTFAILGLIAAFTGQIFGTILTNPIFVTIVVALLIYLALSMFGFYEIYIPKFMKKTGDSPSGKSILSIFFFGLVSGSIASPCVSPGLVLLLSIVTTLGSKILGFLLLLAFGLGLGFPLIIVGTFSGSMSMMPKAGAWMLEIKKIFGLLLIGVCFYFLSNIIPQYILLWMLAGFLLLVGIFYLYNISKYDSKFWKLFKNILGVGFCALSVLVIFNAYKETYLTKTIKEINFWEKDYNLAMQKAKSENKKLFIDFGTTACSICKAIDKKVFTNKEVVKALEKNFVNLKVDGSDLSKEPFASLNKKYKIIGFPTFLLIDPKTQKVIKRWSSEFYSMPNKEIIKLINEL